MKIKVICLLFILSSLIGDSQQHQFNHTSFIDISDKSSIQSKSAEQLKMESVHFLVSLQAPAMVNMRKTIDGRKCADQFNADNNTVVSAQCSILPSPDGQITGRSWCEIDSSLITPADTKNWEFCEAILDFDELRAKVKQLMLEETPEILKVRIEEEKLLGVGTALLQTHEKIKKGQSECFAQTEILKKSLLELNKNYKFLLDVKTQWEEIQRKTVILSTEVDEIREAYTDDRPENCDGIMGYEQEPYGDGVKAFYHNNEAWQGEPKMVIEPKIDYSWNGEPPLEGISHENFSVKWNALVKTPISGKYTFTVVVDGGVEVMVNEQPIISHNMDSIADRKVSWMTIMKKEKDALETEIKSEPVNLIGGQKFFLDMKYYHTIHNKFNPFVNQFITLSWSSPQIRHEVISTEKYYSFDKQPPLKVVGYTEEDFYLRTFQNYDDAFKDSSLYKLADIPPKFVSVHQLRGNYIYAKREIKLATNQPTTIYIAQQIHKHIFIPFDFADTHSTMTVLKVAKQAPVKEGYVQAKDTYGFKIFSKSFKEGEISLSLSPEDENNTAVTFLLFYTMDLGGSKTQSCGGSTVVLSDPSKEFFASCDASSEHASKNYDCQYAFSEKMEDQPRGMWASNGEGVAAWIEIKFKELVQITGIKIRNRAASCERNKKISALYSTGDKQAFKLRNTDGIQELKVREIQATSIKFQIEEVYSAQNNGMSISISGFPCFKEPAKFLDNPDAIINFSCTDSVATNKDVIKQEIKLNDKFLANCQSSCIEEADKLEINGKGKYTKDSPVCLSAMHAGALGKYGGNLYIRLDNGMMEYEGSLENGIQSKPTKSDPALPSVVFEAKLDESVAEIESVTVGLKVDLQDAMTGVWVPGQISALERNGLKDLRVTAVKDGALESDVPISANWPAETIVRCGEKINDRLCDKPDVEPPSAKHKPLDIKICFAIESCPEGFIQDAGAVLGERESGDTYGWGRDNAKNFRKRADQPDPLLANFALFPPDKTSSWCTAAKPDVVCDPVEWSIKVPNGNYEVKLTYGDNDKSAGYAFELNTGKFIEGELLNAGQFDTKSQVVAVTNEKIILEAKCDSSKSKHCDKVWSRICAIQILETKAAPPATAEQTDMVKDMGCGNSFQGGRCAKDNPLFCVYADAGQPGTNKCSGSYHLVKIPQANLCREQRGMFKCIKNTFSTIDECNVSCPGKCIGLECKVPIVKDDRR